MRTAHAVEDRRPMNGVRDMGGMHGFGSTPDDDAFDADWNGRLTR